MNSVEKISSLDNACAKLVQMDEIRHVAVINKLGRPVASKFKSGIPRLLDDEKIKMVYMQMMLDLRMRQELDEILGPIDYITSRRKNVMIISVPTTNHLVLISADKDTSSSKIIKRAEDLFDIIDLHQN
ncbi:hypothetical protein NKOR_07585 [Candidatus Nitrosopumilus koreensis AR1]|uniref:Roadblock/LAMTOR2 domain-containing protein n=1 Tax=Candidatus Nitrosopumilus koreensis AR1 TaxID=1229908 RepID=K0B5F1_9ARCH|nr:MULTISPECIES: DUF6659 family protein [Nitrosopumilus]AFS81378.1 hypothetical protein NKOR_07585 [Candidatus Nitrosopumilus koreensis AR1]